MYTIEGLNEEIAALKVGERLVKSGVPEHIYHQTEGLGSTAFREAVKSMAHYKIYKDEEREQTIDMIKGSAIHTLILEPDEFFNRFVFQPDHLKPGNNNAWKDWKAQQTLPVLTRAVMGPITAAADAVMSRAAAYFTGGEQEKSYWFRDPSGLILKARVDYELGDLAVDLKSTKDDTPRKFLNTIRYDYHLQDALYRRVTELPEMIFIGVCKQPPHQIFAVNQCAALRAKADALIDETIKKIQIAEEFDDYPLPPIELLETQE